MKIKNITSGLANPASWLIDWIRGGAESDSGVSVDSESALGFPPIWYAVNKIAGHVGQLPLTVHQRLERGSQPATDHAVYNLLKTRPNEYQTAIVFKEQLMTHALLTGNGRAAIVRRGGVAVELIPMLPHCTWTCMVDGEKWHAVTCGADDRTMHVGQISPTSRLDGKIYKIHDDDVLHIPGLGYDGLTGRSLVQAAKDAIGLGLAAQRSSSRTFKNGGKPSVVIEAPPNAFRDENDAQEFIDNFNTYHEGLDNTGKAALMREGMKLTTVGVSAADAEWIAQRGFQRQEMALLFLLESILGDDSSVSYNSLEQKNLAYLSNCLNRWLVKWEQECDYKLLNRKDPSYYCKFNTAALLKSDYQSSVESLSNAITARIISPNEAREKLDMNPYDGGDEYANPAITPGAAGASNDDEPAADPPPTKEPPTPEDANRLGIIAHLRHMIGVEAKQVTAAAGNTGNYLSWVDKFYDKKWNEQMRRSIELLGSDAMNLAAEHCDQSRHDLIELAGSVTPDGLAAAVHDLTQSWPERAETLATAITKETATHV